jgi:hypothetical protein
MAPITGHSLTDVEAVLDVHYLGRMVELAESTIQKLEKANVASGNSDASECFAVST